jgi:pimeloyl-ACP methyl ester carboxylesterase
MFDPLMRELAADRFVVAPDTPGYGMSDPPPGGLSISDYTDALTVVINNIGLGEFDILGVHTGARIAVELARQWPEQLRNVILLGAAVYTEAERAKQREWTSDGLKLSENSNGSHLVKLWNNWARYRSAGVTDAMIDRYMSDSLRQRDTANFAINAVLSHDMGAALSKLNQPVLVFNVRDDIYNATKRSMDYIKAGQLIDLSPTGLWSLETRTVEMAQKIRLHCNG